MSTTSELLPFSLCILNTPDLYIVQAPKIGCASNNIAQISSNQSLMGTLLDHKIEVHGDGLYVSSHVWVSKAALMSVANGSWLFPVMCCSDSDSKAAYVSSTSLQSLAVEPLVEARAIGPQ